MKHNVSSPLYLQIITAVSAAGEEHAAYSMGLNYGIIMGMEWGEEKLVQGGNILAIADEIHYHYVI